MSSTDRLIMAAQDITDALKHPHPDVPFATIGDDTISALETLADIFTKKFKKTADPVVPPAPIRNARIKEPEVTAQPTLESPIKIHY